MKTQHLHDVWSSPDNGRLTSKQFSFRLPVHLAAKLAALCDIYPQKNRTQIVSDLLSAAIDDLEKNLPEAIALADPEMQTILNEEKLAQGLRAEKFYRMVGVRGRFREAANDYYQDLEKELGNDSASELYPQTYGTKEEFTNK